ncbi:MAG: rRNA maturation RNase YbeY [Phycisphaerales bacterium]
MTRLAAWLRTLIEHLHVQSPIDTVAITIVDDDAMRLLHQQHCGDAATTDVLTFDLTDGEGQPLDVELVLCVDAAAREAATRTHTQEHELLLYALHGLLHCIGFDDHDEASAQQMHAAEDALLEEIGVGALYRDDRNE